MVNCNLESKPGGGRYGHQVPDGAVCEYEKKRGILKQTIILAALLFFCIGSSGAAEKVYEISPKEIFNNSAWTGDFDQIIKRRIIRVLVPYSKTFYFLDGATPRGAIHDIMKVFEIHLNKKLKSRHLKIHLVMIPTDRDRLISDLADGMGDIAAGNLTITADRLNHIDFSDPLNKDVTEILVTRKAAHEIKELKDLSGQQIWVRKSSSYYQSLLRLNKQLAQTRLEPVEIMEVNEVLEDEDILEMMNAGIISMSVIDSHKGKFWSDVFEGIQLHPDIRFRKNGQIAWAIRKKSPQLKLIINEFVKQHKKGTLLGNIIFKRYLKDNKYIRNNLTEGERKRFEAAIGYFKKYGRKYRFDHLLLAALAYQESRIDQTRTSGAGAVGVMQVLPSTAADKHIGISDIDLIEPNIHAGAKYLRFLCNRYFNDPAIDPLNQVLFSFAAYNAGPAKIRKLRKQTLKAGRDPNVWFDNVEVAAAKQIGRETVQYVSNIYKYYFAYRMLDLKYQKKDRTIRTFKSNAKAN